jgi:hypothetical protein
MPGVFLFGKEPIVTHNEIELELQNMSNDELLGEETVREMRAAVIRSERLSRAL